MTTIRRSRPGPQHRITEFAVRGLTVRRLRTLACCGALAVLSTIAHAQSSVRLVEDVGASEQRDYVAVTLVFGCTLRYVSHTPASTGDAVQVRLSAGPDCGPATSDISQPLTTGASGFVRSVEAVRPFGSDVEMRIAWNRAEQFVIVPSFDGRGLRIRLLRPESRRRSTVGSDAAGDVDVRGQPRFRARAVQARKRSRRRRRQPAFAPMSPRSWSTSSAGTGCAPARSSRRRTRSGC